uniref:RING-type domain-containing protein n=1 Tax=Macrostomum lignano TaxID=282301 RepID=A0A1I8FEV8_9PLAT
YRRTYDSESSLRRWSPHYTWPALRLSKGSEVRSQRRGLPPSRCSHLQVDRPERGLDCHQRAPHPHHTGLPWQPASQTAAVEYFPAVAFASMAALQSRIAAACCVAAGATQCCCNSGQPTRESGTASHSPQRQPQRPPKAGLAHIMQTKCTVPLLSIMDKSSLSSSCYAIHLPPPSAAAAVAPGGPGTAYCWNAAAAAHPGCTYGGYGSFQQQPVMMPHQCQHQLHQLQQQQQQQPYCGNVNWHCGIHGGPAHPAADPSTMGLSRGCSCHDLQHHHHKQEPPQHRTQHVYESYNSEERDNDEDTACYHDAQSRLRPSRPAAAELVPATGASAAGHHEAADVDPCGELLSTRRRRTSSSSRMNRDEHSLQHHHYRTSASNCRPAGNSTSAAETPEQYGGTRRHLATRRHNVEAASGVTRCSSPPHYRDHRSHPHHLHQHHHRLSANDELGDRAASAAAAAAADADEPTPTSAFLHYG